MNPRENVFQAKKEDNPNPTKHPKVTTTSSRQWSNYKNPRIVRVSRAFGGKDRHSKVCTVRGLRDRRIRLSVPTAIQLYDLQDRLGLSQPSKVVDWLISATKHDIDKLPPLPMLPGNFAQLSNDQSHPNPQSSLAHFLNPNQPFLGINQTKEDLVKIGDRESLVGKDKWISSNQEQEAGLGGFVAQNLFPLTNQSSFPNVPYNSYLHWDPSNLSLSQFGGGYAFSNQTEDQSHGNNLVNSIPSNSHVYLPSINPSFPSYATPSIESDFRQINNLQNFQQNPHFPTTLHLISSPLNLKTVQSQENDNGGINKKNKPNS